MLTIDETDHLTDMAEAVEEWHALRRKLMASEHLAEAGEPVDETVRKGLLSRMWKVIENMLRVLGEWIKKTAMSIRVKFRQLLRRRVVERKKDPSSSAQFPTLKALNDMERMSMMLDQDMRRMHQAWKNYWNQLNKKLSDPGSWSNSGHWADLRFDMPEPSVGTAEFEHVWSQLERSTEQLASKEEWSRAKVMDNYGKKIQARLQEIGNGVRQMKSMITAIKQQPRTTEIESAIVSMRKVVNELEQFSRKQSILWDTAYNTVMQSSPHTKTSDQPRYNEIDPMFWAKEDESEFQTERRELRNRLLAVEHLIEMADLRDMEKLLESKRGLVSRKWLALKRRFRNAAMSGVSRGRNAAQNRWAKDDLELNYGIEPETLQKLPTKKTMIDIMALLKQLDTFESRLIKAFLRVVKDKGKLDGKALSFKYKLPQLKYAQVQGDDKYELLVLMHDMGNLQDNIESSSHFRLRKVEKYIQEFKSDGDERELEAARRVVVVLQKTQSVIAALDRFSNDYDILKGRDAQMWKRDHLAKDIAKKAQVTP